MEISLPREESSIAMFGLGFQELVVILFIFLLLFGAKNIPEIAKGLGRALSEFKKGLKETENEVKSIGNDVKKS